MQSPSPAPMSLFETLLSHTPSVCPCRDELDPESIITGFRVGPEPAESSPTASAAADSPSAAAADDDDDPANSPAAGASAEHPEPVVADDDAYGIGMKLEESLRKVVCKDDDTIKLLAPTVPGKGSTAFPPSPTALSLPRSLVRSHRRSQRRPHRSSPAHRPSWGTISSAGASVASLLRLNLGRRFGPSVAL